MGFPEHLGTILNWTGAYGLYCTVAGTGVVTGGYVQRGQAGACGCAEREAGAAGDPDFPGRWDLAPVHHPQPLDRTARHHAAG